MRIMYVKDFERKNYGKNLYTRIHTKGHSKRTITTKTTTEVITLKYIIRMNFIIIFNSKNKKKKIKTKQRKTLLKYIVFNYKCSLIVVGIKRNIYLKVKKMLAKLKANKVEKVN